MESTAEALPQGLLAVSPHPLAQCVLLHRATTIRLPLPRNQPVATTAAVLPVSRLGKPDTRLAEPCVGQGWVQNNENTTGAQRRTGDRQLYPVLRTRWHAARIRQSRHVSGDLVCGDCAQLARVRYLCPHPAPHGHVRQRPLVLGYARFNGVGG